MDENTKPVSLSEIGEFTLIEKLTSKISLRHKSTLRGVGDDAAVLASGADRVKVVTTDMLTEGIHFDLMYTPLKHLGYKAVISNVSDVLAMNAEPMQITVSLAVSSKFSLEAVEELYEGIHLACETYHVDLVGGDTVSSLTGLTISVTAIGEVEKSEVRYRNTARENDLICVSGDLGGAYLGLQILEREKRLYEEDPTVQPELEGYDYILERQLKPEARTDIRQLLIDRGIQTTAMIDISDGLASDLIHICKQSAIGCQIYHDRIPISEDTVKAAREMEIEPLICALHGGEDYELLFTAPLSEYDKLKDIQEISIIGNMQGEKALIITDDGSGAELVAQGWDPEAE